MDSIFLFLIGTVFGSFFGLIIERFPTGESIIFGRSHCDSCQKMLAVRDLIPLFSQLISRSRCRFCHSKIPLTNFFLEFSCGWIFLFAWWNWLDLPAFLLLLLSLILSIFDLRQHSFPLGVWLIFAIIFISLFPSAFPPYCWLFLAIFAEYFDLKIGSGDFLWLFTASFALSFLQEIWLIQLASLLGIFYYFLRKKRTEIPFIPFLTIAYLMLLLAPQIL